MRQCGERYALYTTSKAVSYRDRLTRMGEQDTDREKESAKSSRGPAATTGQRASALLALLLPRPLHLKRSETAYPKPIKQSPPHAHHPCRRLGQHSGYFAPPISGQPESMDGVEPGGRQTKPGLGACLAHASSSSPIEIAYKQQRGRQPLHLGTSQTHTGSRELA